MNICGIIIAKENSNRFPGKNYHIVDGYPLFYHAVLDMQDRIEKEDIFVATDSKTILEYCKGNGVNTIKRTVNTTRDEEPYFSVLKYAYQTLDKRYDYIVTIMANSLGHNSAAIQEGINILNLDPSVKEIRSFDKHGNQSGLFIFRESLLMECGFTLTQMGIVINNSKEIHYEGDL